MRFAKGLGIWTKCLKFEEIKAETLLLVVLKGTDCNQTKENGGDTGRDGVNENKNQKRWKLLSGSLLRIPLNHKATDAFKVIKIFCHNFIIS